MAAISKDFLRKQVNLGKLRVVTLEYLYMLLKLTSLVCVSECTKYLLVVIGNRSWSNTVNYFLAILFIC